MTSTVLVGAQWGDEGKGKITDLLVADFDYVIRYQGGNNAGHTVICGDLKLALHLIPSAVLYPGVIPVIGNGCVVDPKALLKEMQEVKDAGLSTDSLLISENAHIVMPYHIALDCADEDRLATNKIGTTKRGIGPAYQDKVSRTGIRFQDILDAEYFAEKTRALVKLKNEILVSVYGSSALDAEEIVEEYLGYAEKLAPHITDTVTLLNEEIEGGKRLFFEGAQGTLLDIDQGTYPFVTSSSCCSGGAATGTGVGLTKIDRVLGIAKAYVTRVGSGPFPTELEDESGTILGEVGAERGVTTGRARRCGWYDGVIMKYSANVNGLTDICLTKLDVLGEFETIKICTAYEFEGKRYTSLPSNQKIFAGATPVYEELPGWQSDISACKKYEELPQNAQNYIERLEALAGVRISIISVGPDRDQTIFRGWEK